MKILIFTNFLLSIIVVQNAEKFVNQAEHIIRRVSQNIMSCYRLGQQLLLPQKAKIAHDFRNCNENEDCFYEKESIFHKRVENMKAEIALCGTHQCKNGEYMNKSEALMQWKNSPSEKQQFKNVSELIRNCSFLLWTLELSEIKDEWTLNWINETVSQDCSKRVESELEKIMYDIFEGVRQCNIAVDSILKTVIVNNNWDDMVKGMKKVDECSERYKKILGKELSDQESKLHTCTNSS